MVPTSAVYQAPAVPNKPTMLYKLWDVPFTVLDKETSVFHFSFRSPFKVWGTAAEAETAVETEVEVETPELGTGKTAVEVEGTN